ncbi:MAG: hypothetical protein H6876_06240 [Hyphomicrobiaceae bacterium]|nr:hypothetical protein [Hyphomicrobiaceae bacterium]
MIEKIGGTIAHADADKRQHRGADYILGDAAIELKMLNEEVLLKPTHQEKLCQLFVDKAPEKPVHVIDRDALSAEGQRAYDRIVERPIHGEVSKARKQLPQTRAEFPQTRRSVLFVCNNGYTSLDHEGLKRLVVHRVSQDTSQIDGVVIAGYYYHSDGFENFFLWPADYIPITRNANFVGWDQLYGAWQEFAQGFMTEMMRGGAFAHPQTTPVNEIVFEVDARRFVKLAPEFGPSDFYVHGRPRRNSSELETCPPVALVVPGLSFSDWTAIVEAVSDSSACLATFEAWQAHVAKAAGAATSLKPLVEMPVDPTEWLNWCAAEGEKPSLTALSSYALQKFDMRIRALLDSSRECGSVQPHSYIRVCTQEIGQDADNDVSSISLVRNTMTETTSEPLLSDHRMFHEYALVLGAAYAVAKDQDIVLWEKDLQHCWR